MCQNPSLILFSSAGEGRNEQSPDSAGVWNKGISLQSEGSRVIQDAMEPFLEMYFPSWQNLWRCLVFFFLRHSMGRCCQLEAVLDVIAETELVFK